MYTWIWTWYSGDPWGLAGQQSPGRRPGGDPRLFLKSFGYLTVVQDLLVGCSFQDPRNLTVTQLMGKPVRKRALLDFDTFWPSANFGRLNRSRAQNFWAVGVSGLFFTLLYNVQGLKSDSKSCRDPLFSTLDSDNIRPSFTPLFVRSTRVGDLFRVQ